MMTLRRASERAHEKRSQQESWLTFRPRDQADPLANGFGSLSVLREGRLPPQGGARKSLQDAEVITYVREGALVYEDSTGLSGVLRAGEFQRTTAGRGLRYSTTNASQTSWAHVFQIWLSPTTTGLEPSHEQRRFSVAERRGALCVVASPDGRQGSLRVNQDALLHSAILDPGQHIVHVLARGRSAWVHVVAGVVSMDTVTLSGGDGIGVHGEPTVSLTAREAAEIILLELDEPQPATGAT